MNLSVFRVRGCALDPRSAFGVLSAILALGLFFAPHASSQGVGSQGELRAPPGEAGVRVLRRDAGDAAPTIRVDALQPYYQTPDPRALAAEHLQADRFGQALPLLNDALTEASSEEERRRFTFLLAYAYSSLSQWDDAAPYAEECALQSPVFMSICAWWAAQAAMEREEFPAAERWARLVQRGSTWGPRAWFLAGRALAGMERQEEAATLFEEFLVEYPQAYYRADVDLALARAWIATERYDEAAQLLHGIRLDREGTAHARSATELLESIAEHLSGEVQEAVSGRAGRDVLRRAQPLFDRHRSEAVIEMLTPVANAASEGSSEFCDAAWLIGRSMTKLRRHTDSAVWYDRMIDTCRSDELVMRAHYNAGRAYWNSNQYDLGFERYKALWERWPSHSFADDAMHFAARIRRNQGRDEEAESLLLEQIERWPDGDMLKDATWLLMARPYMAGDFRAALRFAESVSQHTGEDDLYSRGRIGYFKGRSLEQLGRLHEALAAWEAVLRDHPMGWYALLSTIKLREHDPTRLRVTFGELTSANGEASGSLRVSAQAARDPGFRLGQEFLRLGLVSLAQSELAALQRRFPNDDDLAWYVAGLYHHLGLFHMSHRNAGSSNTLVLPWPSQQSRSRWETAYPRPFEDLVYAFADERTLDPFLIYAIMREESGFQPRIESWANARGLLQLMLPTARDMARLTGRSNLQATQLFQPEINIELGTMFMKTLSDRYRMHGGLIIAAYNGGMGNVNRWLRDRGQLPFDIWVEEIPYGQTRDYVKRVGMTWWVYHWLYGEDPLAMSVPADLSEL